MITICTLIHNLPHRRIYYGSNMNSFSLQDFRDIDADSSLQL